MSKRLSDCLCPLRLLAVFLVAALLFGATAGPAIGAERTYWSLIPFIAERGAKEPAWAPYALSTAIKDALLPSPGKTHIHWLSVSYFYSEEGSRPPTEAWSDTELSSVAATSGLDVVIAGRCSLSQGILHIRYRVRTPSSISEGQASIRMAQVNYGICDVVADIARKAGFKNASGSPIKIDRPLVANAKSFEMLGRAHQAYVQHKYELQRRLMRQWSGIDSSSVLASFAQTWLLQPDRRVACVERVLRMWPEAEYAWFDLGYEKEKAGDFDGALAAYHSGQKLDPQDLRWYAYVAEVYRKLKRPNQARKLIAKAEVLAKRWPDHLWLALALYQSKEYPPAVREYRAALRLGAPRCYTLNRISYALFEEAEYPQAMRVLRQSAKINPKSARAMTGLGECLARMHKWGQAEAYSRKALRLDRNDVYSGSLLTYVLFKQNKLGQAEKEAKSVLREDPTYRWPHRILETIYVRRGYRLLAFRQFLLYRGLSPKIVVMAAIAFCAAFLGSVFVTAFVIHRRVYSAASPDIHTASANDRPAEPADGPE